jgi:hypothetical protein
MSDEQTQGMGVPASPSGCEATPSAAGEASSQSRIPNAALAGADENWEVGPCVNHLGHVTSWDISVRPRSGDKGVVVIASVYSGEETARAILAAIHTAAIEARRAALTRMVQLDEEMGLYDDEPVSPASGTLTEGGDAKQAPGASLSGAVAKPDAQNTPKETSHD